VADSISGEEVSGRFREAFKELTTEDTEKNKSTQPRGLSIFSVFSVSSVVNNRNVS
jgi:hypothetical protein